MAVHRLQYHGAAVEVSTSRGDGVYTAIVDGSEAQVELTHAGANVRTGDSEYNACFAVSKERVYVELNGRLFEFERPSGDGAGGGDSLHDGVKDKLFAPMPGKIVKVLVAVGDSVEAKQPLVIVESMKMENQALSPASGTVRAIHFSAGDQVDTERPLVELEIDE